MAEFVDPGPLLGKEPDARLAPFKLVHPVAFFYLALLVGIVPTCLLAAGVGIALKRARLTLGALGLGVLGFVSPFLPIVLAVSVGGTPNYGLILFGMRLLALGLGFVLYKLTKPHIRGHAHLEGELVPLLGVIGVCFAASFLMPVELYRVLQLPYLLILGGGG